jgi:hypothetical protein
MDHTDRLECYKRCVKIVLMRNLGKRLNVTEAVDLFNEIEEEYEHNHYGLSGSGTPAIVSGKPKTLNEVAENVRSILSQSTSKVKRKR